MTDSYPGLERPPMDQFVDDLCARDPLAARTRLALLRLERTAHTHGWGHPETPMIFSLDYNRNTSQVKARKSPAFFQMVTGIANTRDVPVGEAYQNLADHVEKVFSGQFDHLFPSKMRERLMSVMAIDSADGWAFYGYAQRSEAWAAPDDGGERPSKHAEREEIRMVNFTARDGLHWQIIRFRGEQPRIIVDQPGNDDVSVGDIPNALSRLTRLFASNPVPIIPARDD